MSSKSKARAKRRKRQRWDTENPLEFVGNVDIVTEVAVKPSRLGKWLARFVAVLPAYEGSASGRARANVIRIFIGGIAIVLVTMGKGNLALGVLGAVVALTALFLPVPEMRKRRWLQGSGRGGETREVSQSTPAQVLWNGQKLSVRARDRGWRSLRPRATASRVALGEVDGRAFLGLLPEHGKRDAAIWFETARSEIGETFDPFEPNAAFGGPPETKTIRVDGVTFGVLLEAFWDAASGGLPGDPVGA